MELRQVGDVEVAEVAEDIEFQLIRLLGWVRGGELKGIVAGPFERP
jgi:hypothetical protein